MDAMMVLKPQGISLDDPHSCYRFQPSAQKPFVCTPAALATYGLPCILDCLHKLQEAAKRHNGLDYLQVFEPIPADRREPLWFIEDGEDGAVTALLPSDY